MIDFKLLAAPRLGYVHPTELRLPSGGGWFNGKIADSDSVNPGSNPGLPARHTGFFGSVSDRAEKCDTCGGYAEASGLSSVPIRSRDLWRGAKSTMGATLEP